VKYQDDNRAAERVYVQRVNGEYRNVNAFRAAEGFRELGRDVRAFEADAMEAVGLSRHSVTCGFVGIVHRALELLGVTRPAYPSLPTILTSLYGRVIRETTLGVVRSEDAPVFIKPLHGQKTFTGHVRGRDVSDLLTTAMLPDRFQIVAAEVVTFAAEWRCFVLRGKVLDARRYSGSFRAMSPDWRVLDEAVRLLGPDAPAGYAIDLGVTQDDRTLVVEVNDGYSLGHYGLAALPYAQLLEARWHEICGSREAAESPDALLAPRG
jgi:ATP-grasp domain, R2K clade family 2